ncbi:MAG: glycoside hydrolase family 2 TIM barrel-domain containing protein [Asticcacaulis sp.]
MTGLSRRQAFLSGAALAAFAGGLASAAKAATTETGAPPLLPPLRLTAAINRQGDDLSGMWAYSKDLYKTGWATLMDWKPSRGNQRFTDVDVAAEEAKDRYALFEYDMQSAPRMALPGAWNAALPQLRYYDGLIWFQRTFTTHRQPGQRTLIRFEAVNYVTQVYINGKPAGAHEGGFTPFTLDITALIRDGVNQITIGVDSSHTDQSIPPRITDWDIYGGVTRPVRLYTLPDTFIDDLYIRYTPQGRLIAEVRLNGPAMAEQTVTLSLPALKLRAQGRTDAEGVVTFDLKAPKTLKLWTPEAPTLYEVVAETGADRLSDRVGLRTIETKGTQLLLNGKPLFLRGICMHEEEFGANPARNMTEPAVRALLTEIRDGLNGNFVRLSHYPHTELTTRMADEMGLLVWSEIPVYWSVAFGDERALATARRMMAENILRDRNRASLIIWSVGNETPKTEARYRFMGTLADDARRLDPSRLISAALLVSKKKVDGVLEARIDDPLVDKLDLMAANTYTAWYGNDRLEDVPPIRWSAPVDKPMIFSEFGADALSGFHAADRRKFSEEFQADFYRATLANADTIPFLVGLSPWILKDFQTPRREHPVYQNGWNRKGLLSETGVRKLAFSVLADHYRRKAG